MFHRSTNQTPKNSEDDNPFLLSFSDLMASLLAIFLLALVVMMIQLQKQKRKLEEERMQVIVKHEDYLKTLNEKEALEQERLRIKRVLEKLRKSLVEIETIESEIASTLEGVGLRERSLEGMLEGIQTDLKRQGIDVLVAENGTVLRIPENELSFKLGEFSIQDLYKDSADVIGATLLEALENDGNRKLLDTVFIEGHTDSVPNRQGMGNWGLSTYRAISLWLHWTDNPGRFTKLKNLRTAVREEGGIERPLISTSGYADTRPADLAYADDSLPIEVGNPANRRIDIRFTLATSEKKDLGEVKGLLDSLGAERSALINMLKEVE